MTTFRLQQTTNSGLVGGLDLIISRNTGVGDFVYYSE